MNEKNKLSQQAYEVITAMELLSIRDPNFQRELEVLATKTEDEIEHGLALFINSEFPTYNTLAIVEEIRISMQKQGGSLTGIKNLVRRSRWGGGF